MAPELRDTGISVVGGMPWGTHFCSFYETKQDLLDILIPFFKTGLKNNEFCLWIVSNSELLTMQEARNALQEVLPDLDQYMGEKSIEFAGHDWFLDGGSFDSRRVANQFKQKVDEALARNFVGMRVNGSPAWLETSNGKALRKFEAEVDQLFPHERIIASCTYPIGSSRADFLLDVARNHRFAIARRHGIWDIVETPELTQAKAQIERLNIELEQRVIERTRELEETTERLRAEIEERKEAEGAVRQIKERFAAFMDNLPGYAWMKDLQGRYVYVNEMVRGLPGYESLGKTDTQIWPADLAAQYRANDKQVIATKRPLQTLEHYQQQGKQRYMVGSKFPIFDETGAVALVGGTGVDITERVEAEEALRESETKLKQAQQLAKIGYWERDLIADRTTWSKETGRIFGLESFRDVPSQALLREFIHPDDWQHHQQVLNEALQGSRLFDVEVRIVRPDGNIRFVHIRDEIVRDESGKPIRMFGAVQDITERKQAEEALRKSEQVLREAETLGHTGSWEHNLVTGQIFNTEENLRLFFGDDLSKGTSFEDYTQAIHPDDREFVMRRHAQLLAEGGPRDIEFRVVWPDGSVHVLFGRATVVRDESGQAIRTHGTNVDITERKQAEDALRRSEDRLRLVINTIPVMAWTLRPDGVVDFLNQRSLDYAGLSLEEYVNDPTVPIHPDDTPRVMEKWPAAMAAGEPYEDEMRLRRADGEYRWFLVRTEPLHDEYGNIVKWYGVSIDIEDRKRAEMESRALIDAIPQQIWSGPPDGTNDYVNERLRAETGLTPEYMRADGWQTMLHPEDRNRVLKAWEYSVRHGTPYEQEERHRRADGTYRWYLNRGLPLRDNEGRIIRWYGTNTDIEDRKRAEEKLKTTTEQLRALSARLRSAREEESKRIAREIHDELGGDLTSLRWDLEEVGDIISEATDSTHVVALRNKVEAMITLTDTTLDTVRRLASELRPIALDELGLVEAIEWQARQFQSRTGISVQCECSLEKVDLNSEQSIAVFRILQEALTNILRHAQATKVTITIKQESGQFSLAIKDNGRGITESEKSAAHSLGLLGMRERALLIGATIDITGTKRKGTEVVVKIPISASD